jgi:hypothetical protein
MICADREFPEPATQLIRGSERLYVRRDPKRRTQDAGIRQYGWRGYGELSWTRRRQFPSLHLRCLAGWQAADTVIARAGEEEQLLVVHFDLDKIREFRAAES